MTKCLGLEGTSGGHLVQPLLKQGHKEQAAQDHVQVAFEDLQGGRLSSASGHAESKTQRLIPSCCVT